MEEQWRMAVLLLALAMASYQDMKEKNVYVWLPAVFTVVGIVWRILYTKCFVGDVLGGMIVGIALLIISYVSEESIGLGDGLILTMSGVYVGFWMNLTMMLIAFAMAGCVGLFMIVKMKKGRGYKMPFLPYILMAYVCLLM